MKHVAEDLETCTIPKAMTRHVSGILCGDKKNPRAALNAFGEEMKKKCNDSTGMRRWGSVRSPNACASRVGQLESNAAVRFLPGQGPDPWRHTPPCRQKTRPWPLIMAKFHRQPRHRWAGPPARNVTWPNKCRGFGRRPGT